MRFLIINIYKNMIKTKNKIETKKLYLIYNIHEYSYNIYRAIFYGPEILLVAFGKIVLHRNCQYYWHWVYAIPSMSRFFFRRWTPHISGVQTKFHVNTKGIVLPYEKQRCQYYLWKMLLACSKFDTAAIKVGDKKKIY